MRNSKHIAAFIEKVNDEAEKAAQAIFDKYQPQLEQMIKNQMLPGDRFDIGMGAASFRNKKGEYVAKSLSQVLRETCYPFLSANFNLEDFRK